MAGYSATPLWKKIGIKEGDRVATQGMPKHLPALLRGVPPHEHVAEDADVVWLFCTDAAAFHEGLAKARAMMRSDGMLWVSWPKKSSPLWKDLTEDQVRAGALAIDLVDVKVCAVDDCWSGLKLVVRKHLR